MLTFLCVLLAVKCLPKRSGGICSARVGSDGMRGVLVRGSWDAEGRALLQTGQGSFLGGGDVSGLLGRDCWTSVLLGQYCWTLTTCR